MVQTWPLARPLSVEETTCLLYSQVCAACLLKHTHREPASGDRDARTLQETARGDTRAQR